MTRSEWGRAQWCACRRNLDDVVEEAPHRHDVAAQEGLGVEEVAGVHVLALAEDAEGAIQVGEHRGGAARVWVDTGQLWDKKEGKRTGREGRAKGAARYEGKEEGENVGRKEVWLGGKTHGCSSTH